MGPLGMDPIGRRDGEAEFVGWRSVENGCLCFDFQIMGGRNRDGGTV